MEDYKRSSLCRQLFPTHSDSTSMRECQRFKPNNPKAKNVINYLLLRNSGESIKKAIAFSTKRFCRYDSTQRIDGTSQFRVLKRKNTQSKYIQKGWATNGEPQIVNNLPDIAGIFGGMEEQDNLIYQLVNTKLDSN